MKTITALQADLEVTPLGTRSRLADEILGVPVLRRSVERALRAKEIHTVHVLCPAEQQGRVNHILDGLAIRVIPYDADPPPWAALVRSARKWSLDGWRGGIGGTTSFDEFVDPRLLAQLPLTKEAEDVLCLPAAAALLDTVLLDRMIEHRSRARDESRLTFTQAPPGLTGVILDRELLCELAQKQSPLGWVFAYRPDQPMKDLIFQPCCFEIPREIRYATGRLMADTRRSLERVSRLLRDHADPDLKTIGRWLETDERDAIEPLPREVEIELTTDDAFPKALLRPRGARVPQRGPIGTSLVAQIGVELAAYDDSLIVLGGFGDPLRHPRFNEVLANVAPASGGAVGHAPSVYGICVRTNAVDLTDEMIELLIHHRVDVLNVILDAWTPELYRTLQDGEQHVLGGKEGSLDSVLERLNRLTEIKMQRRSVCPIIVPEFTKARENVHELDEFHDGWLRRVGAVSISGYSPRAGQCEDHAVMSMAPPRRTACRRIRSRCLVLADGRVTLCDQDIHGRHAVGALDESSLSQIWGNASFNLIRDAHREGSFDVTPLCAACDEWHRP